MGWGSEVPKFTDQAIEKRSLCPVVMVANIFNPSIQEAEAGDLCEFKTEKKKKKKKNRGVWVKQLKHLGGRGRWISEFEASLVCKVSSRTARATQRHPVSKQTNKQTNTNPKKEVASSFEWICILLENVTICHGLLLLALRTETSPI